MNSNEHLNFINQMLSEVDVLHPDLVKPEETLPEPKPVEDPAADISEDEILELGDDFDFDGFQVVRREFFAHTGEPSVTFNNCKFYVIVSASKKVFDHGFTEGFDLVIGRESLHCLHLLSSHHVPSVTSSVNVFFRTTDNHRVANSFILSIVRNAGMEHPVNVPYPAILPGDRQRNNLPAFLPLTVNLNIDLLHLLFPLRLPVCPTAAA